jgi:hypothetical protein
MLYPFATLTSQWFRAPARLYAYIETTAHGVYLFAGLRNVVLWDFFDCTARIGRRYSRGFSVCTWSARDSVYCNRISRYQPCSTEHCKWDEIRRQFYAIILLLPSPMGEIICSYAKLCSVIVERTAHVEPRTCTGPW